VLVFLFPGALVCTLAGAAGMNAVLFSVLNVVGTITTVSLLYKSASVPVIKDVVDAVNGFYSKNFKWLTIVSLVLTGLYVLWQVRKGDSDLQSMAHIEEELEGTGQADATEPRHPHRYHRGRGRRHRGSPVPEAESDPWPPAS
jgi:hypothetical protein